MSEFQENEKITEPEVAEETKEVKEEYHDELDQFTSIGFYQSEQYLGLDTVARYNLELTKTMREQEKKGSLLWVLDHTKTAMGKRMLRS